MNNLNARQQRFVEEYIKNLNATESYMIAYCTNNNSTARTNGSKLLANPNIRKAIDEELKKIRSKNIADATEVMEFLTSVMRGEVTEEQLNCKGYVVEIGANVNSRLKAGEMLAKRYQLFSDKLEVSGNVGVQIISDIPLDDE